MSPHATDRPRERALRRDALRHREALLEAAAVCFSERGYAVPLEEIAERAGVGRGTLYRNFRDRMSLALAIFGRELDRAAALVEPERPLRETMVEVAREGIRGGGLFTRLAAEMPPTGADLAAFEALRARFEALLTPVVERGRASGELRADVTAAQLALATRMVGSLLHPIHDDAAIERITGEALDILFRGLAP